MSTAHWQVRRPPIPAAWLVRSSPAVHQWAIISAGLAPILVTGGYLVAGALQPASYSPMRCAAPRAPVPAWQPAGAAGRRTGPPRGPGPAAAGRTGDGSPPGTAGGRPAGDRHGSGTPGRAGLARLPVAAELATIGAGYVAYAQVRLAIHADRHAAFRARGPAVAGRAAHAPEDRALAQGDRMSTTHTSARRVFRVCRVGARGRATSMLLPVSEVAGAAGEWARYSFPGPQVSLPSSL